VCTNYPPGELSSRKEQALQLTKEQQVLAAENLNLAREIAWRYQRSTGIEYSVLQSAAFEGLCQAAAKYDEGRVSLRTKRTMKFSSLAVPYIRGSILHYIRDRTYAMRLSHRMRELWVKGRKLMMSGSTDRQICATLEITTEEWQDVKLACSGPPLELKDHALPAQGLEPEESVDFSPFREEAREIIDRLPAPLKKQLEEYCGGRLRAPSLLLQRRFSSFFEGE
jgi:DNA-directed RNA polymerase specialized sigma subunit